MVSLKAGLRNHFIQQLVNSARQLNLLQGRYRLTDIGDKSFSERAIEGETERRQSLFYRN